MEKLYTVSKNKTRMDDKGARRIVILCKLDLEFGREGWTASESFPISQLFAGGGQSTGVSVLALFLPKKSQG